MVQTVVGSLLVLACRSRLTSTELQYARCCAMQSAALVSLSPAFVIQQTNGGLALARISVREWQYLSNIELP